MKKAVAIFLTVALATLMMTLAACSSKDAKGIFKSECATCHKFRGIGSGIIDLSDITERRSDIWIKDQIEDARRHDESSGMPRFRDALTGEQIDSLVQFLHSKPQ